MAYFVLSCNGEESLSPDPDHLTEGPSHEDNTSCLKSQVNQSNNILQTDPNSLLSHSSPGMRVKKDQLILVTLCKEKIVGGSTGWGKYLMLGMGGDTTKRGGPQACWIIKCIAECTLCELSGSDRDTWRKKAMMIISSWMQLDGTRRRSP